MPVRFILVFAAVLTSAKLGVDLSRLSGNIAAVWIANAIPLGIILVRPRAETPWYLAATVLGNLAMNLLNGDGLPASAAFAGCNFGEVAIATAMLRYLRADGIFCTLRSALKFLLAAVFMSTAVTAALGAAAISAAMGLSFLKVWTTWWLGDAVGMLIVTPFIVAIGRSAEWRRPTARQALEFLLLAAALIVALGIGIESLTGYTLAGRTALLAIVPIGLWAAIRFGATGATLASIILTVSGIALAVTMIPGAHAGSPLDNLQALQIRILSSASISLVLAALLGERSRAVQLMRQNENELRKSNTELEALIATCPLAIVYLDRSGKVQKWNAAAERMFGWGAGEVLGRPLPTLSTKVRSEFEDMLNQEKAGKGNISIDTTRLHKNGQLIDVTLWASPRFDASGEFAGSIGILADVTERKQVEEQLRQYQRLQAVGQLTGGVAHEFNNLLLVILGNAETLSHSLHGQPQLQQRIKMIETAAQRGADLTHRLLAFSRRQALRPEAIDLKTAIDEFRAVAAAVLDARIKLRLEIDPTTWPITSDRTQFESALLNLVINSRDAMPSGGVITIRTSNTTIESRDSRSKLDLNVGRYVAIEVADSGSGMTEEVALRATEPFFTTKEIGKGTGLGLSMVHGFVRQSGGDMQIRSQEGAGTTIRLLLPAAGAPAQALQNVEVLQPAPHHDLTIVVAEDDPQVLETTMLLLSKLGYRAVGAPDGKAAMSLLQRTSYVDVLLTDVIMPNGISGLDLARKAAAIYPNIKILFMSGYNDNVDVHKGVVDAEFMLLNKPFSSEDLQRALSELMGNESAAVKKGA
jgi:PAS domain S-box-containing protein